MLRLERDLAERMFKRANGAKVIVATPTLAQGLNLPAHLAILAGDKRADADQKGREDLERTRSSTPPQGRGGRAISPMAWFFSFRSRSSAFPTERR